MTVVEQRARAVEELINRVRAIEMRDGVTRASLDSIKAELIALASRTELFPAQHFANAPGPRRHHLPPGRRPDGRFALYGSAGVPGKAQPPHNHTTWASIAGVFGDEHNVFYERTDRGETPGEGRLKKLSELTIQRGSACAMLPDDFHTIEVTSKEESLHLHLYGKTLEDLPDRITFRSSAGGRIARFMAKPEIYCTRMAPQELRALTAGGGGELAILDVREEGVHARGHLFLATSAPLSQLGAAHRAPGAAACHAHRAGRRRRAARAARGARAAPPRLPRPARARRRRCRLEGRGLRAVFRRATCPPRRSARWSSTTTTRRASTPPSSRS